MKNTKALVSSPNRSKALPYMMDSLKGSLLAKQIGKLFPEQGNISLVTSSLPPEDVDYFADWSKSSCVDWLIADIDNFIKLHANSLVLFEDIISLPSDPFLSTNSHPPFWNYQERIFWPITSIGIKQNSIESVMAWTAGIRIIAGFSILSSDFSLPCDKNALSDREFQYIASSITRLVIDVYEGGGYMVWKRNSPSIRYVDE